MSWRPEIEGWSGDIHAFYERIVKELPIGARVAEIGIYRGRSVFLLTERLVELKNETAEVWGIDPLMWDGGELWRHTLTNWLRFDKRVGNMFRLLRAPSTKAARMFDDKSLDLVFIDGEHNYENVAEDIDAWMLKVKPGGILAGHDYSGLYGNYPGVARAVHEKLMGEPELESKLGHYKGSSVWWVRL